MFVFVFRGDELSAPLGLSINRGIAVANKNAFKGVKQFLFVVSADGTSRLVLLYS